MSEKRRMPAGEKERPAVAPGPAEPQAPGRPADESKPAPTTTGDMQEVGATRPEEVPARRRKVDGESPVHENPGDQNSG